MSAFVFFSLDWVWFWSGERRGSKKYNTMFTTDIVVCGWKTWANCGNGGAPHRPSAVESIWNSIHVEGSVKWGERVEISGNKTIRQLIKRKLNKKKKGEDSAGLFLLFLFVRGGGVPLFGSVSHFMRCWKLDPHACHTWQSINDNDWLEMSRENSIHRNVGLHSSALYLRRSQRDTRRTRSLRFLLGTSSTSGRFHQQLGFMQTVFNYPLRAKYNGIENAHFHCKILLMAFSHFYC